MIKWFRKMYRWFALMWMVATRLTLTKVGKAAKQAVMEINAAAHLRQAAKMEPMVSYCRVCGQLPTGNRLMEEARERAIEILGETPKMSELNFALEYFHYISRK